MQNDFGVLFAVQPDQHAKTPRSQPPGDEKLVVADFDRSHVLNAGNHPCSKA